MAGKSRILRLASVIALGIAAPLLLVAPAGASAGAASSKAVQPALFTVQRDHVAAGKVALFTAKPSGQSSVTSYGWTLSGPGVVGRTFSATCGAHTSRMESSFGRAGVVHATVRISYASGAVSTATRRLFVTAGKVRPVARKMAKRVSHWVLCLRGPADPPVQLASSGGPPAGCQDEYFDGSIDLIGCLSVLPSYSKIPAPERALLCPVVTCTKTVPELLPVLSKRAVRLNGIDISPGRALVLDQNDGWAVSSKATASLLNGLLPLRAGKLRLALFSRPRFSVSLSQLLAKYPALGTALNLSGLQVSGKLTVVLARGVSIARASVTLPPSFTGSGGKPVTSRAIFTVTNQAGLVLDDMLIAVPSASFGDTLEFDHLAFCYQQHISAKFCEKKTGVSFGSFEGTSASSWNATAKINILGTEITAVPTPTDPEQGIGFVNGQFDFAGASVAFNPAVPLGSTGVSLTSLGGSVALNPTRIQGSIGLTAGDLVSINGQVFLVFASPSQPYTFNGHEVGATGMPTPTVTNTAVAVGGNVGIDLPVLGNQQLASGYVLFYPGTLDVGGGINLNILSGALTINGGINGQFSLDNTTFNVEGNLGVSANVLGLTLSMSAQAVVSSTGIGACGSISTPFGPASAGVGYTWGGSVSAWIGSCDLSPYIVVVTGGPGNAGALTGPVRLHVPAGLPTEMIQIRGHGGAPEVAIAGPGGSHASIETGDKAFSKPFMIFRNGRTDTTYIVILKPGAGTYTITANPGSPRIAEVLAAQGRNGTSVVKRLEVHVRAAA